MTNTMRGSAACASTGSLIQIRDASCHFGDVRALAGVSLDIAAGEILALLGPNGAGKTTLVRALATLGSLDGGSITVGGFDVATQPHLARTQIGLAGQYAAVDGLLTGRENLEIAGRLYRLPRAEAAKRAAEGLERLTLTAVADKQVRNYSGGQRRRLDLGASLVGKPRVLLLDEPTTGLDPRTRADLWAVVRQLVDDGTTVLLTTQYLEEADALADRIAVIDEGRIIAVDTPAMLKERKGSDRIRVRPRSVDDVRQVRKILRMHTSHGVVTDACGEVVSAAISRDQRTTMLGVTTALLSANIEVQELMVQQATLDEVFLTLTDRPSEVDDEASSDDAVVTSLSRWAQRAGRRAS